MTQIAEPGTTWDEAPPAGRISHWINGRVVAGTSGREGPVYNPAMGTVAKHVDFASVEEVERPSPRRRRRSPPGAQRRSRSALRSCFASGTWSSSTARSLPRC